MLRVVRGDDRRSWRQSVRRDPSHLRPPVGQRLTGDRIPLYPTISRHIPAYPGSFFLFAGRVSSDPVVYPGISRILFFVRGHR